MYLTNNALTPDPEIEPSILTSSARDWPFMRRGIRMSGWDDNRLKYYMLGNPIVWLGGTVAILGLVAYWVFLQLAQQRKVASLVPKDYPVLKYQLKMILGGWALHYLPFFLMGRVLYVHHYYPALLFAILTIGIVYDRLTRQLAGQQARSVAIELAVLVLATFVYFSPMAYGIEGPSKAFLGRRWIRSWNL